MIPVYSLLLVCFYQYKVHTGLRVQRAPGVPHALFGRKLHARLGRFASRGRSCFCTWGTVIARSVATKQSIPSLRLDGLLRGACHPARILATRWLAMTIYHYASSRRRPGPIITGVRDYGRCLLQCLIETTRRMGPGVRRDDDDGGPRCESSSRQILQQKVQRRACKHVHVGEAVGAASNLLRLSRAAKRNAPAYPTIPLVR